jgi:hypothetical protein
MKSIIKVVFAAVVLVGSGVAFANPWSGGGGPTKACATCKK